MLETVTAELVGEGEELENGVGGELVEAAAAAEGGDGLHAAGGDAVEGEADVIALGLCEAAVEHGGEGLGEEGNVGADARDLVVSDAEPDVGVIFVRIVAVGNGGGGGGRGRIGRRAAAGTEEVGCGEEGGTGALEGGGGGRAGGEWGGGRMELVLAPLEAEPGGEDDAVVWIGGVEAGGAERPAEELGVSERAKEGPLLEVEIAEEQQAALRRIAHRIDRRGEAAEGV